MYWLALVKHIAAFGHCGFFFSRLSRTELITVTVGRFSFRKSLNDVLWCLNYKKCGTKELFAKIDVHNYFIILPVVSQSEAISIVITVILWQF